MFKILLIFLSFITFSASGAPTVYTVFRIDSRPLSDIIDAGGMWPRQEGEPDDDLTHHFEGESIEGRSSNFVSTTSSLRDAVTFAASLARPNSEEPFDEDYVTYIYQIRPTHNFFSVDDALITARDSSPESSRRRRNLTRLIRDYTGLEEFVAHGGFDQNRIISYAEITGDMLRQYYDRGDLFSVAFWSSRWINNPNYNISFNNDTTSILTYARVADPDGHITRVINGSEPPVPLSFTCQGVSEKNGQKLLTSKGSCSTGKQYLSIRKTIYEPRLLLLLSEGAKYR